MNHKVYLFIFALALTLWLGNLERVSACNCGGISSCGAFYRADLVFIGKAVSSAEKKIKIKISEDKEMETEVSLFDFEISEVFGNSKKFSKIAIVGDSTTCDFPFKVDETYLVFAYKTDQNQYTTNICTHTNKLSDAMEDLKFLREVLPQPDVEVCPHNAVTAYTSSNSPLINIFLRL